MADNKVHYDLEDVYVAPLTGTPAEPAYGEYKKLDGAISMDLAAQGDVVKLRADGIDYYVSYSNNGYNGNLNLALVPDWFKQEYLGETMSTKDKVLVETASAEPSPCPSPLRATRLSAVMYCITASAAAPIWPATTRRTRRNRTPSL